MHAFVKLITGISIALLIKVVLVGGQRLLAFPFHVLNEVGKPPLHFLRVLRCLVNISDFARDMPVATLVDIYFDPRRLTGGIPVMFSVCFWGKLRSLATQKQGDGGQVYLFVSGKFEIQIKGVAMRIAVNTLLVKVAPEQDHGILCETDGFDPPTVTAFTECPRFVFRSKRCPITQHQSYHFGHSCTCFEEQPGYDFIAQPCMLERELLSSLQDISWEFGIINDLGLPLVMF